MQFKHDPQHRSERSTTTRRKTSVIWAIILGLVGSTVVAATAAASHDAPAFEQVVSDASVQPGRDALATAAPAAVHGVAPDGTPLDGMFEVRRFEDRRGTLYAVGRLVGELGGQEVSKQVRLPVTGASNEAPAEGLMQPHGLMQPQQDPTPGACDILTLALGPLDLDLLGLRVALSPVDLLIEAIPGAGNLLGNLLCAVAGLLDGGLLGNLLSNLLGAITDLLNGLLDV
jgi:hypothetical protein